MNKDEKKIVNIRRHPFGLVILYMEIILASLVAVALILFLAGDAFEFLGLERDNGTAFTLMLGLILAVFVAIYLVLVTKIYWSNRLIVTNDNVTHISQVGLFHRKSSEISMANVEDVSAHEKGIFSTLLNFGRLHIETAGEQNNLDFLYCPNPNAYAKVIQDARLEFIKTHGD